MSWTWRCENENGEPVTPGADTGGHPAHFPTQSDAESWVGEMWQELLDAGIAQVTLLDGDRTVYGPMSLSPAQ